MLIADAAGAIAVSVVTMPEAWAAALCSGVAQLLIARRRWTGYVWAIASNLLWLSFAVLHGVPPLAIIDCAYLATNCYGLRRWRREA